MFVLAAGTMAADRGQISVRELAISEKARGKYDDAQRKIARKDVEGGRKRLREALEIAPEYAAAWNALGAIAPDAGDAEDYFRRAVACDAEHWEAVLNLGGLLLKTGRPEEALGYSERAAHELRGDAEAQAQWGMNLYQLGRLSEAEAAFLAAKRIAPEERSQPRLLPELFLAEIYARRGEKGKARAEIEALLARKPDAALQAVLRAAAARLE